MNEIATPMLVINLPSSNKASVAHSRWKMHVETLWKKGYRTNSYFWLSKCGVRLPNEELGL